MLPVGAEAKVDVGAGSRGVTARETDRVLRLAFQNGHRAVPSPRVPPEPRVPPGSGASGRSARPPGSRPASVPAALLSAR